MAFAAPKRSPADALGAAMGTTAILLHPPLDEKEILAWKNIPGVVQDALIKLANFSAQVAHASQATAMALTKKANAAELGEALGGKASNEQLTELARFVQKDLMTRLDGPCSSHMQATKALTQTNGRISQLEAVVSAQDSLITRLQRQMTELQEQHEHDLKNVSSAVAKHVEHAVQAAIAGLATREEVEQGLRNKVDNDSLQMVVRDLHTLDSDLQTRATKAEVPTLVDERVKESLSSTATSIKNSTQAITDGCMRSVAELRRAVQAIAMSSNTSSSSSSAAHLPPPTTSLDDNSALAAILAATTATGSSSAAAHHAPAPSALAGGKSAGAAVAGAASEAQQWKNKLALLSATFESKLEKSKKEVMGETKKMLEAQLSEVVDTLNRKAFKNDVLKAVALKADITDVNLLLSSKVDKTEFNAKMKTKAESSDLLAVRRSLNDMAVASALTTATTPSSASAAAGDAAVLAEVRTDVSALRLRVQQLEKQKKEADNISDNSMLAALMEELQKELDVVRDRIDDVEKTADYALSVASKATSTARATALTSPVTSSRVQRPQQQQQATPDSTNPLFVSPSEKSRGGAFSAAPKSARTAASSNSAATTPATVAALLSAPHTDGAAIAAGATAGDTDSLQDVSAASGGDSDVLESRLSSLAEEVEAIKSQLLNLTTSTITAPAPTAAHSSAGAALMGNSSRLRPYSSPARPGPATAAADKSSSSNSSGSSTPAAVMTPPRSTTKAATSISVTSDSNTSNELASLKRQVLTNSAKIDTVVSEIAALTALSVEVQEFKDYFSSSLTSHKSRVDKLEKMALQASNTATSATNAVAIINEHSSALQALDTKVNEAMEDASRREERLRKVERVVEDDQERQELHRNTIQTKLRQMEMDFLTLQQQVETVETNAAGKALSTTSTTAAVPAPASAAPPATALVSPVAAGQQQQQQPPLIKGRWVWKSRQLDSEDGLTVLWDVEAVNTTTTSSPQQQPQAAPALLWGGKDLGALSVPLPKDIASLASALRRSDILAVKGGLYQLSMAFFSPAVPPIVTVLVNGKAVISTTGATMVNKELRDRLSLVTGGEAPFLDENEEGGGENSRRESEETSMVNSGGSVVLHRHHPSGSVGGLSVMQFLALPPKAVITILYDDNNNGGGGGGSPSGAAGASTGGAEGLLSLSGLVRGDGSTNASLLGGGVAGAGGEGMRGQGFIELVKL
jgi:hypothetical protein